WKPIRVAYKHYWSNLFKLMPKSCIISDSAGISNVSVSNNSPNTSRVRAQIISNSSRAIRSQNYDLQAKHPPTTIIVDNSQQISPNGEYNYKTNDTSIPNDNCTAKFSSNSEEQFFHKPVTSDTGRCNHACEEVDCSSHTQKVFVTLDSSSLRHNVSDNQTGEHMTHSPSTFLKKSSSCEIERPITRSQLQTSPLTKPHRSPHLSSGRNSPDKSQLDNQSNKWTGVNNHRLNAKADMFGISSDEASSETTNTTEEKASMKPSPSSSSLTNNLLNRLNQLSLPVARKLKFWNKKSFQVNNYDPTFKVIYLGNLGIQLWSKEDSCVAKPILQLWNNYQTNVKTEIVMRLTICNSGLKAITRQHGLTQYWSNRLIYCCSHKDFPKIFCWIYRHEGKKMRQELRCHAVLCPSSTNASKMVTLLNTRLTSALQEFRREKQSRQNSRMNISNSSSRQEISLTMPLRKQILTKGSANFRPPLERSKSAPKLSMIHEIEEDENDSDVAVSTMDVHKRHGTNESKSYHFIVGHGRKSRKNDNSSIVKAGFALVLIAFASNAFFAVCYPDFEPILHLLGFGNQQYRTHELTSMNNQHATDSIQLMGNGSNRESLNRQSQDLFYTTSLFHKDNDTLDTHIRNIIIPRVSGTPGNVKVRNYLISNLENLGYHVEVDEFVDDTPLGRVKFANVIASNDPDACEYLVFASHYDSKKMDGFVGACDSAVPTAMLLEIAQYVDRMRLNGNKMGLRFIFFDGEEAFVKWTDTDSLYGSRHLAKKWASQRKPAHCGPGNELSRIKLFVLLDLIGTSDVKLPIYDRKTKPFYRRLTSHERLLSENSGVRTSTVFTNQHISLQLVQDDHQPFSKHGVPILLLLSGPFPEVWHTINDNYNAIDFAQTRKILSSLQLFVFQELRSSNNK
ncbi:Glutaminyl-peptide cyclotransferase, partial [Fragariocoptes setiger]